MYLTALAYASAEKGPEKSVAPNLIFLMSDQHRDDAFTGGRFPTLTTPNFDKLFQVRFGTHYTSVPSCTPARAGILTGRSPWRHGQIGYGEIAHSYAPYAELVHMLADAGYKTIAVGKNHFELVKHGFAETHIYDGMDPSEEFDDYDTWFESVSGGQDPLATHPSWSDTPLTLNDWRGAAYMYNESWHPTAWTANTAAQVISNHSASSDSASPLFLKVSFHRPHSPYDPPARLLQEFSEEDMPTPKVASDGWDTGVAGVCASSKNNFTDVDVNTVDPNMWCGDIGAEQVMKLSRPAYVASVKFVDEGVGIVLDALDAAGMTDNTAILYTSDHGDALGDHMLWRKTYPYESSSRIPLALWFGAHVADKRNLCVATSSTGCPSSASDMVSGYVTELRDVMPTLLDLAGVLDRVPVEQPLDGSSLLPLLSTNKGVVQEARANWREWIDLEHGSCYNGSNHWSALTDGAVKYVFHALTGNEQLFNLTNDPDELIDIALSHPDRQTTVSALETWRGRLAAQFQAEGRGSGWVSDDGELMLRPVSTTYSPFYPASPEPTVGDAAVLEPNGGGTDCNTNDCFVLIGDGSDEGGTRLRLDDARLVDDPLCLSVELSGRLVLDKCAPTGTYVAAQHLSTANHTGIDAPVVYEPNSTCAMPASDGSKGDAVVFGDCHAPGVDNSFVFGASGRLCITTTSLCLHANASWPEGEAASA